MAFISTKGLFSKRHPSFTKTLRFPSQFTGKPISSIVMSAGIVAQYSKSERASLVTKTDENRLKNGDYIFRDVDSARPTSPSVAFPRHDGYSPIERVPPYTDGYIEDPSPEGFKFSFTREQSQLALVEAINKMAALQLEELMEFCNGLDVTKPKDLEPITDVYAPTTDGDETYGSDVDSYSDSLHIINNRIGDPISIIDDLRVE